MTKILEVWKDLKFVSDAGGLTDEQIKIVLPVLEEERRQRKHRKIQYLLNRSGIKRVKLLEDFDWKINPKLPKGKESGVGGTCRCGQDPPCHIALLLGDPR